MKKLIIGTIVCLFSVGCVPTEEQVFNLGNDVDILMSKIDDQQEKLTNEIDKVQERVKVVNEAVKAAKTLPEKAAAGIEASRPFNPYADQMTAILGIATAGLGLFWSKEKKKRQADKDGRERTLRELAAMKDDEITAAGVKSLMFSNIGEARKG